LDSYTFTTAFLLVCTAPAFVAAEPLRPGMDPVDASVRQLVEKHCGSCHDGALDTAKPAALRVFDLREESWTARMSKEQLKKVIGRTRNIQLTGDQRREIEDFIQKKIRQRSTRRDSGPLPLGTRGLEWQSQLSPPLHALRVLTRPCARRSPTRLVVRA